VPSVRLAHNQPRIVSVSPSACGHVSNPHPRPSPPASIDSLHAWPRARGAGARVSAACVGGPARTEHGEWREHLRPNVVSAPTLWQSLEREVDTWPHARGAGSRVSPACFWGGNGAGGGGGGCRADVQGFQYAAASAQAASARPGLPVSGRRRGRHPGGAPQKWQRQREGERGRKPRNE
jgi:hypothetical protein